MASSVTVQDLVEEMRKIMLEGHRPSVNLIRDRLGTTASQSTLVDLTRSAWQEIGRELESGIPGDIPSPVLALVREMWRGVRDEARQTLDQEREAHQEAVEGLTTQVSNLSGENSQLRQQLEHDRERLSEMTRRAEDLESKSNSLAASLDTEKKLHQAAETARQDASVAHEREIARLRQSNATSLRQFRAAARASAQEHQREVEGLQKTLSQATDRYESDKELWMNQLDRERTERSEAARKAEQESARLVRDRDEARNRAEDFKRRLRASEQSAEQAYEQLDLSNSRLSEISSKADALTEDKQSLKQQIASQRQEIESLNARLAERTQIQELLDQLQQRQQPSDSPDPGQS